MIKFMLVLGYLLESCRKIIFFESWIAYYCLIMMVGNTWVIWWGWHYRLCSNLGRVDPRWAIMTSFELWSTLVTDEESEWSKSGTLQGLGVVWVWHSGLACIPCRRPCSSTAHIKAIMVHCWWWCIEPLQVHQSHWTPPFLRLLIWSYILESQYLMCIFLSGRLFSHSYLQGPGVKWLKALMSLEALGIDTIDK